MQYGGFAGPGDPTTVGGYEVFEALGEAGLAAVYRGRATHDGVIVAVKVLRAELADDPDVRRRFGESVEAAMLVPAEGTAPILAADLTRPRPYVVLQYVTGRNLLNQIQQHGPLEDIALRHVARVSARVLAGTHQAGVLHRNIKPKTILLTSNGPLVIGFGYAVREDSSDVGVSGDRPGVAPPVIPEVVAGVPESRASDIFAWGTMIAHAATGIYPFGTGLSIAAKLNRVLNGEPELAGVPDWLHAIVAECLAKDPADRPTAAQILDRLPAPGGDWPIQIPAAQPWRSDTRVDFGPGFTLDGYEVYEALGEGGNAVVYRGRKTALGRDVAIKVLYRRIAEGPDLRRFRREVDAAVRLSEHPGVVTLYDAATMPDGRPYLVMELCPGGSLADRLDRTGPLPVEEVCRVGIEVADAVAAAHAAGVLHRDIKPANLLVTRFGRVALADFGIASLPAPGRDRSVTLSMTPAYAAPEIFDGAAPHTGDDVYSLGATLYTLLAGRPPHCPEEPLDGAALIAYLYRTRDDPVPAIPGVPEPVMAVLRRSLHRDPTERYTDAGQLRDGLSGIIRG